VQVQTPFQRRSLGGCSGYCKVSESQNEMFRSRKGLEIQEQNRVLPGLDPF